MNEIIRLPLLLLLTGVVLSSGCSSARPRERFRPPPQPVLTGNATFNGGALELDARLDPFQWGDEMRPSGRRLESAGAEEFGARRPPPSPGGGYGGGFQGGDRYGVHRDEMPAQEGRGPVDRGGMRGVGDPIRLTLTVNLRNNGSQSVRVRIMELSSPIGNFVAVPESFTLEPGATQTLDAMHSNYPESFGGMSLVVRIRTAAGDEEKIIQLAPAAPEGAGG